MTLLRLPLRIQDLQAVGPCSIVLRVTLTVLVDLVFGLPFTLVVGMTFVRGHRICTCANEKRTLEEQLLLPPWDPQDYFHHACDREASAWRVDVYNLASSAFLKKLNESFELLDEFRSAIFRCRTASSVEMPDEVRSCIEEFLREAWSTVKAVEAKLWDRLPKNRESFSTSERRDSYS